MMRDGALFTGAAWFTAWLLYVDMSRVVTVTYTLSGM